MNSNRTTYRHIALLPLLTLLLTACGVDRRPEFQTRTDENRAIESIMKDYYLWYDQMPTSNALNFFADAETFFYKTLKSSDKFSYFESGTAETKAINRASSYGFDFAQYTPKGSKNSSYALVLFVLPHSPASEAGLKRGDWIAYVNETHLTTNNYGWLLSGPGAKLGMATVTQSPNGFLFTDNGKVITLSASREVEDNPFYVDSIYQVEDKRIGYLMYNRFSTGPNDTPTETTYNDQMRQIFTRFQGQVDDFILDLRYNPGGYLTCSQLLASLLAPQEKLGNSVYCTTKYNDKHSEDNFNYLLEKEVANLNLSKLYVITSTQTASASEAVIYCLKSYMEVITIGENTVGKNVGSVALRDSEQKYPWTLHPIVAQIYNANDESDYASGIIPTYPLVETEFMDHLYDLGDTQEIMLESTIQLILKGSMPEPPTAVKPTMEKGYNSLERRTTKGMMLP